jgi:hypothetical protein
VPPNRRAGIFVAGVMMTCGHGTSHRRIRRATAAVALVLVFSVEFARARADWRLIPADFQGGAIFLDENPGMTSMDFLRFEVGTRRLLVGTEAIGFRFQMEKQVENRVITDGVHIWETLPLAATYVVYDWQVADGLTSGYRYLCLYGKANALLARTFDTKRTVRYAEGGIAAYWNGPHQAPVISLSLRAGYRLQQLGGHVEGEVTHPSEIEHQLLFGLAVALDLWSSSYRKRRIWRKENRKRDREWQYY